MKKVLWTGLKVIGIFVGLLLLLGVVYVIYMLVTYHRIEDMQELAVVEPLESSGRRELTVGESYRALTYNIGFGAYTPDFSFFMDGGESSWAESEESVRETVLGAAQLAASYEPDFILLQEVDIDSTRSYHVDQNELLRGVLKAYYSVFAINYDSSFMLYPFTQPHGSSKAGLALYSSFPVTSSLRRSLPISDSLSKFVDLDRCYSISRIPADNGKELVIMNLHMSAYGNSDAIRQGQVAMLCEDMRQEYAAGNYVICGGDFNHDLKVLVDDGSERATWAYPFPREKLPEHFAFCIDSFNEEERQAMWNSSRNADMEYVEGVTYTVTLDGFIISDNIECKFYENVNAGYRYADHDPVYMDFKLK